MSIFGPRMGNWYVRSKSDPRWDNLGRAEGFCCDGGPKEMKDWIDECKRNYGKPPDDAEMGFYKD